MPLRRESHKIPFKKYLHHDRPLWPLLTLGACSRVWVWQCGCDYGYGYLNLPCYINMQPGVRIPGLEEPKNSSKFLHLISSKVRVWAPRSVWNLCNSIRLPLDGWSSSMKCSQSTVNKGYVPCEGLPALSTPVWLTVRTNSVRCEMRLEKMLQSSCQVTL